MVEKASFVNFCSTNSSSSGKRVAENLPGNVHESHYRAGPRRGHSTCLLQGRDTEKTLAAVPALVYDRLEFSMYGRIVCRSDQVQRVRSSSIHYQLSFGSDR
ncbi:hypothetical protein Y032_0146g2546 [Ancylostoma ceylanicum]|uniref:Uncharacterized protein n=1 Tax=Ancylostoma ceylanicum TaxID=53326 RepID=A0A016T2L9_9BILA|nr:hypothetical protein Y032_0146g2546 [Ancylostoma ceylanicum]